jgi:uncharacterized protein (TIGR03382 family)
VQHNPALVAFTFTAFLLGSFANAAAQGGTTNGRRGDAPAAPTAPQVAEVDTDFASLLVVHTKAGEPVHFSAPASGATAVLAASVVLAGDDGVASVAARAGTVTGDYQIVASGADGVPLAAFVLGNTPGAPATIIAHPSSTPQHAQVASDFAQSLAAEVRDRFGNGVPGVTVTFEPPGRGATGEAQLESTITDDLGRAKVGFDAGTIAGSYQVIASAPGVTTDAVFELTNLHGAPYHTVVESGGGQHAVASAAFAEPLLVRVDDAFGNAVAGATVTVNLPDGGATAHLAGDAALVTDADGRVALALTAGTVSGSFQVTASATLGAAPAVFELRNDADVPASLAALPGATPQTAQVRNDFSERLAVAVVDRFGNPVSGARVRFATSPGEASVELELQAALTSDAGVAAVRARAGSIAGASQVTARVDGVEIPVTFELHQAAGRPAHVVVAEGGGQRAFVNGPFSRPVYFRVVDGAGNPVAGTTITLVAPGAGPTAYVTDTQPITDATGAAVVELTAGDEPGSVAIYAVVEGAATPARLELSVDAKRGTTGDPAGDEPSDDTLATGGCSATGGGATTGLALLLALAVLALGRRRRYTMA